MNIKMNRRRALWSLSGLPLISASKMTTNKLATDRSISSCSKLRLSLNAYSFNRPLSNGDMTVESMIDYCAQLGFDAVDITAYYFPGYPNVPSDDYLYGIKKKAFLSGMEISGTGVRNDFTDPDREKRKESILLVKKWIEAAEKLGAPVIRIFAGKQTPPGYTWDQIANWMVEDILECVDHGKQHGVVVAIQNHHDFIKTADQVETIMKLVDSDWFGLILDTGSYRMADPYEEIARSIPYAVNWQVKEKIYVDGKEVDTDLDRLISIINASCYRGYLPIETLRPGDPKAKVPVFYEKVKRAIRDA